MRLFFRSKDGGKESHVWGYWLIEWKQLFSIALLCFEDGTRDAYHSHAFNARSWVLFGMLEEYFLEGGWRVLVPSIWPVITSRNTFHKVSSVGRTWVLTFRGPWDKTWKEYIPATQEDLTLTHGRIKV